MAASTAGDATARPMASTAEARTAASWCCNASPSRVLRSTRPTAGRACRRSGSRVLRHPFAWWVALS